MPGSDSRYADGVTAHETRLLAVPTFSASLARAGEQPVGETVLEAVLAARALTGRADLRSIAYLAPLARSALNGERLERTLSILSHEDAGFFARALEATSLQRHNRAEPRRAGRAGRPARKRNLEDAVSMALKAGRDATLRDAVRLAAATDPTAREYTRGFEITRELARPALLTALGRIEASRPALVHAYLEVLSEVPDLDVVERAGQREAEEVSRMARGVLKVGGVSSRRGLQAISNLDGILRGDSRLMPTATETPVLAAAFLISLEHGPESLSYRVRPASLR